MLLGGVLRGYIIDIPAHTNRPQRSKNTNCSEIRTPGCNHAKNSSNTYRGVEGEASPEDVAAKAPEYGAKEKTYVLG